MAVRHPEPNKKLAYISLLLSLLLLLLTIVLTAKDSTPHLPIFAAENLSPPDANQAPADSNAASCDKPARPDHSHPAFGEQKEKRAEMVAEQIRSRGVSDPNVLNAMLIVPRHAFVRDSDVRSAYDDHPLPIGQGQTISQPYIVAYMTEALKLGPQDKVLEIGTGSGYQAAVCAEIAREVYTIEILDQLAESAEKRLKELGYNNVFVKAGDGYLGWPQKAPFDAIIITAAVEKIPKPLMEQLKVAGRIILPQGNPYGVQTLVLVTKQKESKTTQTLLPVRFVPMTGKAEKPENNSGK